MLLALLNRCASIVGLYYLGSCVDLVNMLLPIFYVLLRQRRAKTEDMHFCDNMRRNDAKSEVTILPTTRRLEDNWKL